MPVDSSTLIVAGIMAVANFGGIALVAKKYSESVDKHNEVLPGMVASLENISSNAERTSRHLEELFAAKNEHSERLKQIETIHQIRGCNEPIDSRWRNPSMEG